VPSTDPPQALHLRASGGLNLQLAAELHPRIRALLERELDGIAALLAPWGRFVGPVRVRSAESVDALRLLAGGPTDGVLHAAATGEAIALLAPERWTTPPGDHEIVRVLAHELAHALLFQRCSPAGRQTPVALPCWFREGMAVVASEGRPDGRRRIEAAARPDWLALAHADAAAIARAGLAVYDVAATLFDAWFERYGIRSLHALAREMRSGRSFADAFMRACGVDESGWLAETCAHLGALARDG
jgi:hypothetical protein